MRKDNEYLKTIQLIFLGSSMIHQTSKEMQITVLRHYKIRFQPDNPNYVVKLVTLFTSNKFSQRDKHSNIN